MEAEETTQKYRVNLAKSHRTGESLEERLEEVTSRMQRSAYKKGKEYTYNKRGKTVGLTKNVEKKRRK